MKIGDICKIKQGREGECRTFKRNYGVKIQITQVSPLEYDILDKDNNKVSYCSICFTEDDLIPPVKTLNDLEIGDVVENKGYKRTVLSVPPSSPENRVYILSDWDYQKHVGTFYSAEDLKDYDYKLVQEPSQTGERTVDDVIKDLPETDKKIIQKAIK